MSRTPVLLLCAALLGASGLGLEVLAIDMAGLPLGYGRSGPIALALFIAGWAAGARWSSTWGAALGSQACKLGVWLVVCGALLPLGFAALAQSSSFLAWLGCTALLLAIAVPQGAFLPLLARGLGPRAGRDLSVLFACNLAGAALGSWLFGSLLPAAQGRWPASLAAGLCALLAGVLAWRCLTRGVHKELAASGASGVPVGLGALLALTTAWAATLEWFGVRLGVLWLGGMQDVLGSILVASLLSLSLGAALLPRLLPRGRRGLSLLAALCCLSSLSYFFLPSLLQDSSEHSLFWRSLLLVGPALMPFGGWIPMLHRELAQDDERGLGQLLGYEAIGALLGLPLVHFVLLPQIGLGQSLLVMAALSCVLLVVRGVRPVALAASGVLALVVWSAGLFTVQPALQSPPLQNPAFEILSFEEDEHFAISVVQDGLLGERTLMTDGFRAAASGRDYAYMRALAHLPLLLHPRPAHVGVLAFGTGTTAGAVSLHAEPETIEVLELSGTVTGNAHWFEDANRGVLQDPRVSVSLGDGRRTLRDRVGRYDVLTMEPLLPDSPFAVYLYTEEFYHVARSSLAPGGLVCQWVPPHALEPATFDAVLSAFTSAFEWSGVWLFGTQVILLGGGAQPQPNGRRWESASEDLRRGLAGLGLHDVQGVLARYVLGGADWPAVSRPLTDLDPWVIYTPRRKGAVLLADLPLNLASLRANARPFPVEWLVGASADAGRRVEALSVLREVREAFEAGRARGALSGLAASGNVRAQVLLEQLNRRASHGDTQALLESVRALAPQEPGLLRFEATLEFQSEIRRGYALLVQGVSEETAAQAAVHLTRAALLRPERADVHAYLAVALRRLDSDRAQIEIRKAYELCPNLGATPIGPRLVQLGFGGTGGG